MHSDFWHERWQQQQIGFHQGAVNQHLQQWWDRLELPVGATVFVPLCGKSLDLLWLAQQGYRVLGVELSEIAVRAFFDENGLSCREQTDGALRRFDSRDITIFCGDFFALTATQLAGVAAVFDRAALVALPAPMRQQYARHLQAILPAAVRSLLITFEYDQSKMSGPPFSVAEQEVEQLFGGYCAITRLLDMDVLVDNPGFRQRGIGQLREKVFRLER